jgi:hypothetical protein
MKLRGRHSQAQRTEGVEGVETKRVSAGIQIRTDLRAGITFENNVAKTTTTDDWKDRNLS